MNTNYKLLCSVLFLCSVIAFGNDGSSVSEKDAFERLYFRIKEERLSGKDCEEMGFVDQTGGEITVTDIDGKKLQMSFDNEFEGLRFEIELRNKENIRLTDIKMESRFFYLEEREWRTGRRSREEEMKFIDCSLSCTLASGAREKIKTDAFLMNSYEYPSGVIPGGGRPSVSECKPEGIWIRITYTTSEGQKLEREICDPKSLSEDITWDGKSI